MEMMKMKAGILVGHFRIKGNEGSLIRTAEAFGVNNIFVIGKKEKEYLTSEGACKHVNFFEFKNYDDFITFAKGNNYSLVCIENLNTSKEITEIDKYPVNPIFISGNERNGVDDELLKHSNICVRFDMGLGYTNCLNTATACAIVIHDFHKKMLVKRYEMWEEKSHR
jgi:tRNA G18 (ribose-2'-O)-methylase SpoU